MRSRNILIYRLSKNTITGRRRYFIRYLGSNRIVSAYTQRQPFVTEINDISSCNRSIRCPQVIIIIIGIRPVFRFRFVGIRTHFESIQSCILVYSRIFPRNDSPDRISLIDCRICSIRRIILHQLISVIGNIGRSCQRQIPGLYNLTCQGKFNTLVQYS